MINKQNRQCNECYKVKCNDMGDIYSVNKERYNTSSVVFQHNPSKLQINYLNQGDKIIIK